MRQSMLEVVRQDYIQSARAKGLAERVVIGKHALRNAMLPIVTILGLSLPGLIGGSVIVESVFAIPGMGQLMVQAVFERDYPVIMGNLVIVVLILVALAIFAPVLAPWDPNRPDIKKILAEPSGKHPLGTDQLGRDVLSRMLYGARVSLAVGFVSVGIATLIGIALGAGAGYHGGTIDAMVMRLVDLMLVFPRLFLLLAVLAFLRPSIWTIMAVIGLTGWMGVARLVRAEFLALKEREFVVWSH